MAIKKSTFLILLSLVMAACGTTREKQFKTVDMGYGETSQEALSYAISSVDMEEADKNDLWRTAQKHHITAEDLARLIALKEKENAALLKRAEERKAEAAPAGAEKEENKNDSK